MTPLIPNRNPQGPSDPLLDVALREVLREQESARDFGERHGFLIPTRERFQWRKCLAIVLCVALGKERPGVKTPLDPD
jgi:hypothetical protein